MGKDTAISWTHHTFNPWWGCVKVSDACTHCYAETFAERWPASRGLWGKGGNRRFQSGKYWDAPLKWERDAAAAGERRRVFCASMADVFEDRADLVPHRARLFDLIRRTPHLDWLLLTKRPENVMRQISDCGSWNRNTPTGWDIATGAWMRSWLDGTPPANIWLGTTVENQEQADKRIPALLKIRAKVRFLSCEPLLGPVDLISVIIKGPQTGRLPGATQGMPFDCLRAIAYHEDGATPGPIAGRIDWVICGGESGPHARPMHPDWARGLRDQCANARVPFHFKQWGKWYPIARTDGIHENPFGPFLTGTKPPFGFFTGKDHDRLLDGILHDAFPNCSIDDLL